MRVITGTAKGMRLITPEGLDTRPTTTRTKESVFSAIQFKLEGAAVLDLFAGSGQMGIEALSRGAKSALFIDKSNNCNAVISQNLEHTKLKKQARVLQTDAEGYLTHAKEQFDFIFVDPPFQLGYMAKLLPKIEPAVKLGGIVICETSREDVLPEESLGLSRAKEYPHGNILITLYKKGE